MSDFRFAPGDLVKVWGRTLDIRRLIDTEHRRAYVTAGGVHHSRATVDGAGTLVQKAYAGQKADA